MMIRSISFTPGGWSPKDFLPLSSRRFPFLKPLSQAADHVNNELWMPEINDYAYISHLWRQELSAPCVVTTHCSFDRFGAPILVFTDPAELRTGEEGRLMYGRHFEFCAYEKGLNVWDLALGEKDIRPTKAHHFEFPIAAGPIFELRVSILPDGVSVSVDGQRFDCSLPEFPGRFYAGFTACEGINRFYDLKIEVGDEL